MALKNRENAPGVPSTQVNDHPDHTSAGLVGFFLPSATPQIPEVWWTQVRGLVGDIASRTARAADTARGRAADTAHVDQLVITIEYTRAIMPSIDAARRRVEHVREVLGAVTREPGHTLVPAQCTVQSVHNPAGVNGRVRIDVRSGTLQVLIADLDRWAGSNGRSDTRI